MNDLVNIEENIKNKIYNIRWSQVMLDKDLAELYWVETRVLNQAVKRNIERFDEEIFMFQLTKEEFEYWKSQIVISNSIKMWLRKIPLAFTEQWIYMLATVLKSKIAIKATKEIMKAFVNMRKFLLQNTSIFQRIDNIEYKLLEHNKNFDKIFHLIESNNIKPTQWIFYNWQIYDAYIFINDLLKSSKKEIILVDNYLDDSVFTLFSKYPKLKFIIITKSITNQLQLDIDRYNSQYQNLEIKISNKFHDRFLILDNKEAYHLWASLKDLWKKVFDFSKIDVELLNKVL